MPKNFKRTLKILVPTFLLLFSGAASAQLAPILSSGVPQAPISSLTELGGASGRPLETLVIWFIGIFWVITVGMVIWAAFLYLTAGENEEKISEAKKRLLYAVIAAAIALLATGIDLIVETLLTGKL